jgi:hypothetical protein
MAAPKAQSNRKKELLMKRDEIFPSRFLKAADFQQPRAVTIAGTAMEQFKNDGRDQDKLVITFKTRGVKPLVCNLTNFNVIAKIAGSDDTDAWPGVAIELFADRVPFGRNLVDSVRVREPAQAALPAAGNGKPPARAGRPRPVANPQPPAPQPEPDTQDDGSYDDEVPFR